jgi:hypothetical protein
MRLKVGGYEVRSEQLWFHQMPLSDLYVSKTQSPSTQLSTCLTIHYPAILLTSTPSTQSTPSTPSAPSAPSTPSTPSTPIYLSPIIQFRHGHLSTYPIIQFRHERFKRRCPTTYQNSTAPIVYSVHVINCFGSVCSKEHWGSQQRQLPCAGVCCLFSECDFTGGVEWCGGGEEMFKINRTNLWNKGLISADRRTSLLSCLQYPVPYLSRLQRIYLLQYLELWFSVRPNRLLIGVEVCRNLMMLALRLSLLASHRRRWISSLSSMDSDLEAFSHNPTDGSFAALAFQLTACTNYLNQRFLSY